MTMALGRLAIIVALSAVTAVTAGAHGKLKSARPARGSQLSVAPTELRLEFTESPEVALARFELVGPDGKAIELGPLTRADQLGRTLTADIRAALTNGTFTVKWRIAGADGHPVSGSYQFSIAAPATGLSQPNAPITAPPATAAGAANPDSMSMMHHDPQQMPEGDGFGVGSVGYIAIRWLLVSGLLIVIGAVAFRYIVLKVLLRSARQHTLLIDTVSGRAALAGLLAAAVVGLAALLRLVAQSYAMHGSAEAWAPLLMITMLTRTIWGWGWLLQLAGMLVAVAGFAMARRGSSHGWTVAALGTLMLAVTPALSGHAVSAPTWTTPAVLADTLHVIGAGGWLGSLLMLIGVGIPAAMQLEEPARGPAVADLVNAFSPTALFFAGISGITGVFAAWLHMGSFSALWQSAYGQTLLVKLGILSVVAGTGAYNWLRVKPTLGSIEGARRIRRSGNVELVIGVLVLVVTAVLVATPTPMDAAATGSASMP